MFVNKDLFSNPVVKQMNPSLKPAEESARKLDMTFMPLEVSSAVKQAGVVTKNPLSSSEALEERERLLMTTKERERKARETPIVKSLFDFKGNSKFKVEQADILGNQAKSAVDLNKTAAFGDPTTVQNPFKSSQP